MKKGKSKPKVVESLSTADLNFDEDRIVQKMSDVVKSATEDYLNEFLKEKVLPITPVDFTRVNKYYGTREELSSNAGVSIASVGKDTGVPLKYRAYVHFGQDPVSKDYAIIQHEVGRLIHFPPARDKFLQIPFQQVLVNEGELLNRLADKINSAF